MIKNRAVVFLGFYIFQLNKPSFNDANLEW